MVTSRFSLAERSYPTSPTQHADRSSLPTTLEAVICQPIDMADLRPGMLLVASPVLADPNFFRSVVLIMDHDSEGTVGVVLDRPLELNVSDHLPAWCERLAPPARVFEGGPVQPETAIGVAHRPGAGPEATWRPTPDFVGFVDVSLEPDDTPDIEEVRIFSGYAGWGAGQLEMELATGSWFPVQGSVDDVFDPVPATLWRRVLLRQDPQIARYANYPIDPRSN